MMIIYIILRNDTFYKNIHEISKDFSSQVFAICCQTSNRYVRLFNPVSVNHVTLTSYISRHPLFTTSSPDLSSKHYYTTKHQKPSIFLHTLALFFFITVLYQVHHQT